MTPATRHLDLYLADTRENLRVLNRALLTMEESGGRDAVDEAFRAVHTIKGLAASVGHDRVAALAHALEDRLDALRQSGGGAPTEIVDALLATADAVEVAIEQALRAPAPAAAPAAPARSTSAPQAAARPDGARRLVVRLASDTVLAAARALLISRSAVQSGHAERSEPAEFDDAFGGEFTLLLADAGAPDRLEALVRNAGDVEHIRWEADSPAPAPGSPPRDRQVRVDADRLDVLADAVGELAMLHGRLEAIGGNGESGLALGRMGTLLAELQQATLALRMVPVGSIFDRFPRLVRDAARALGKRIELRTDGGEIELDRAILEEITEPLVHLVRNAVDHGIEDAAQRERKGKPAAGTVRLRALRGRGGVSIEVGDDGGGIDAERVFDRARALGLPGADAPGRRGEDLLRIMSEPGFSTADGVSDLSGRGVGLDVVVTRVRALGGSIDLDTRAGEGTTFTLRLPVTLALTPALRVRVSDGDFVVPLTHLAEVIDLRDHTAVEDEGRESVLLRDAPIPVVRLRRLFGAADAGEETAAIVAEVGQRRAALAVDALIAKEPILIRAFDAPAGAPAVFSGTALLADGRPALVLDPVSLV